MATEAEAQAPKSLRVLICGAGVAGPATAFWLSRMGHHCTIIERFRSLRKNGLQIDVRKEGVEAVRRMGLLEEIKKHVIDEPGTEFVDTNGKRVALFPKIEDDKDGKQGFTSEYEIMRHDLCKVLVDASTENVTYRYGISVSEFENGADSVKVTFDDNTVETFDLVVAADGQGSRIRKMLLKEESPEMDQSRNIGIYMAFFTSPRVPDSGRISSFYIGTQRRMIMTRTHTETEGQVYLAVQGHAEELDKAHTQDVTAQKEAYAKIFKDAGWKSEKLLEYMHSAEDFYSQSTNLIRSGIWSKGRVVLVGDAGYSPTPLTGMGTSVALIGATILCGELSKHGVDNLPKVFEEYERIFRPYVDTVQDIPKIVTRGPYCEGKLKVRFVNLLLGTATKLRLDRVLQNVVLRAADPFRIPQYPELDKLVPT